MAITRSRAQDREEVQRAIAPRAAWRSRELALGLAASLLVGAGLYLVHRAKTSGLPEIEHGLASKRLLNLNALATREELLPALTPLFPKMRERDGAARDIYYLGGGLSNVGAIARQ